MKPGWKRDTTHHITCLRPSPRRTFLCLLVFAVLSGAHLLDGLVLCQRLARAFSSGRTVAARCRYLVCARCPPLAQMPWASAGLRYSHDEGSFMTSSLPFVPERVTFDTTAAHACTQVPIATPTSRIGDIHQALVGSDMRAPPILWCVTLVHFAASYALRTCWPHHPIPSRVW